MKKFRRQYLIIIVLGALVITAALALAASYNLISVGRPQIPVNLTAVPLAAMTKPVQFVRMGSVQQSTSVPIHAEASGHVGELYVTAGQTVKAGQPLLSLEAAAVQTVVSPTTEPSPQSQADYDKALDEVNRYQKLFDMGAISRRQLELAAARLQEAKASLNRVPDTAPTTNPTVTATTTTITAPISGNVTGIFAAPGAAVQIGQQLITLGSGQTLEVVIPLGQDDLYLAHLGTPSVIEAGQQQLTGQIASIYPQTDANQIVSFLAHIKLMNDPGGLLTAGMAVTVRIDTGKSATVPAVPSSSIFQDDQGRSLIYLAVNGHAKRQQIMVGDTIGDLTELTSDLPQQSMIITSHLADIKDGDAITLAQ